MIVLLVNLVMMVPIVAVMVMMMIVMMNLFFLQKKVAVFRKLKEGKRQKSKGKRWWNQFSLQKKVEVFRKVKEGKSRAACQFFCLDATQRLIHHQSRNSTKLLKETKFTKIARKNCTKEALLKLGT